jgi:enterochelin esterase family protein
MAFYYAGQPDPLNPVVEITPAYDSDPASREVRSSVIELPDAPPQRWFAARPDVQRGAIEELTITSAALGEHRRVWMYRPPQAGAAASNLLVLTDGHVWMSSHPIGRTLDNLIADGRIPPMVVAMVDVVDEPTRTRDLTGSERFLAFLTDDLLPLVRSRSSVTDDPRRTAIAGQSYGGLTALYAGLKRPDVFGNVLSQAGAFQSRPDAPEWLTKAYAEGPKLPLRLYLDVGVLDHESIVDCNRRLRAVLERKGYDLTYVEFNGGHEFYCWRGTIADGLIALLAD